MTQPIPYLPDNAPFTPEQRAYLNGLLAGMFSSTAASGLPALPHRVSRNVAVYFATQTGTAERLAKKFAKQLKSQGHVATVASLDPATPAEFASHTHVVIFASTYGDGEAPDSAKTFRDALFGADAPALNKLTYAVFALGDRSYEQFCRFGVELDERLAQLGAHRLETRVESDVEVDAPFETWAEIALARLAEPETGARTKADFAVVARTVEAMAPAYTREAPLAAPIVERRALTSENSSKMTIHLAVGLDEKIRYEAGDACGVIAQNDPALVDEILALLPFAADAMVELPKIDAVSVRDALLRHTMPTRITRKMVQAFAEASQAKALTTLLQAEQASHLDAYMWDRGLIDLLEEYPGVIGAAQDLVAMLPRLTPRLYSISSSPARHGRELHCTIAVVRYRSHNRQRGGVASTMLADRADVGTTVPIYIQPNKRFRLPSDGNTPIVMIGPGTGIAPFRAFLHERQALGHQGRNWLFFGERSAQTDFLYQDELYAMTASGHLTRLDTAFSRDQAEKIYVQDRMVEHGDQLWSWLADGARVYVCGDALRMAKDVDNALHQVIGTHGQMDEAAARDYVSQMQDDGRYHKDVY